MHTGNFPVFATPVREEAHFLDSSQRGCDLPFSPCQPHGGKKTFIWVSLIMTSSHSSSPVFTGRCAPWLVVLVVVGRGLPHVLEGREAHWDPCSSELQLYGIRLSTPPRSPSIQVDQAGLRVSRPGGARSPTPEALGSAPRCGVENLRPGSTPWHTGWEI